MIIIVIIVNIEYNYRRSLGSSNGISLVNLSLPVRDAPTVSDVAEQWDRESERERERASR